MQPSIYITVHLTDGWAKRSGSSEYLFQDQLNSVIAIIHDDPIDLDTFTAERRASRPFGEISTEYKTGDAIVEETKGFVGERYDAALS